MLNTAGCFLYRAGRYDEALKWLQASMIADPGYVGDCVFLAMVHHRQNRPAVARKWLDKAKAYHASEAITRAAVDPVGHITLQVLIREAEEALADLPKANGASNGPPIIQCKRPLEVNTILIQVRCVSRAAA
jgi:hypothetical protein